MVSSALTSFAVDAPSSRRANPGAAGQNANSLLADDELWRERLAQAELLIAFQGKGSSFAYDAGVIKQAWADRRLRQALSEDHLVVSGNSSGSVYAVYYSCFGFSNDTIEKALQKMLHVDVSKVRENERGPKVANMIKGQETVIEPEALKGVIAFALGVDASLPDIASVVRASSATPRHGVVIAAANAEVLASRAKGGSALRTQDYKVFDRGNFDVSWKPDVFEFYRQRPEQFAKDHPDLTLGSTPFIGKAVTYFVDETMYKLLSRIPPEERLGDLRLLKSQADLALAIQASAAEPTYFAPVEETDYSKLRTGDELGTRGNSRKRKYAGGFIMPLVAQDIRRMLPSIRVLGTSVGRVPLEGRKLVRAWYLVDLQVTTDIQAWWADLDVSIPRVQQEQMLIKRKKTRDEEYTLGFNRAHKCFAEDHGLPKYVIRPKFTWPAKEAIVNPARPVEFEEGGDEPRSLKTRRGLWRPPGPELRSAPELKSAPDADVPTFGIIRWRRAGPAPPSDRVDVERTSRGIPGGNGRSRIRP